LFGELGSKKRVGFSVRGGQPAGTERQRERGAFYSISIGESRERPNIGIPPRLKEPSVMVWVTKCIVIIMATITLTRGQRSDDAVRFPDSSSMRVSSSSSFSSSQSSFTNKPVGTVRPCEGNADFCDFAFDYPQNIVPDPRFQGASLIKGKIFHTGSFDNSVNDVDVTQRFNTGGERKERACKVRRDIIYPQKARNSQGSYLFIVNQDTFRQAVEVEQCLDEGSECLTDSDAPSSGTTVCRQEYTTHRLYATDGNGEQVYDSFSLPSACLCHFRDNFGLKSGFGVGIKPSQSSQLPICRAGIQLNLPSGGVQAAQGAGRPSPPILSQNFREPSLSSSVNGGGSRTQSSRRPSRPAQPPSSLSQNFREPASSSNRRQGNQGRKYYSGGRPFLAQQQKRPRRQYQYGRRGRRFYQRRTKRQTQECSSTFCDQTRFHI